MYHQPSPASVKLVHPKKFNMEPQNEGLEDVFSFRIGSSRWFSGV